MKLRWAAWGLGDATARRGGPVLAHLQSYRSMGFAGFQVVCAVRGLDLALDTGGAAGWARPPWEGKAA